MVDNPVVPSLSEANEGFNGHAIECDQGFIGFRISGRVVVKEGSEIFDPGEGFSRVVWTAAWVDGGGSRSGSGYAVNRGSEDGEGHGEHGG